MKIKLLIRQVLSAITLAFALVISGCDNDVEIIKNYVEYPDEVTLKVGECSTAFDLDSDFIVVPSAIMDVSYTVGDRWIARWNEQFRPSINDWPYKYLVGVYPGKTTVDIYNRDSVLIKSVPVEVTPTEEIVIKVRKTIIRGLKDGEPYQWYVRWDCSDESILDVSPWGSYSYELYAKSPGTVYVSNRYSLSSGMAIYPYCLKVIVVE